MKIKKIAYLFILLLSIGISTNAQKALSNAAIKDFANSCDFQVRFNQNNNYTLVILMQDIRGRIDGGVDKAMVDLTSTETDKKAREIVFAAFNSLSGGVPDRLYNILFSWGLSAAHAKEISDYISIKYAAKEEAPEEAKNTIQYDYTEKVPVDSSEKFFQGTKRFEGHVDDVYKVTINGNKIEIIETTDLSATPFSGTLEKGVILDNTGKEGKFRFRNGALFYHADENEWYVFYELE